MSDSDSEYSSEGSEDYSEDESNRSNSEDERSGSAESESEEDEDKVTKTTAQLAIDSEKDLHIDLKLDRDTGKIIESNLKIVKKEGKSDAGTSTGIQTDDKLLFPDLRYGTHMSIEQLTNLAIEVLFASDDRIPQPSQPIYNNYIAPQTYGAVAPTSNYDHEPSIYVRNRYSLNPIPEQHLDTTLRRIENKK